MVGRSLWITARPFLSLRDQPERRADRSAQPLRAAVPSWLELSPLPRPGALERLAADNRQGNAAVSLLPKPRPAPPPIPFSVFPQLEAGPTLPYSADNSKKLGPDLTSLGGSANGREDQRGER